MASSLRSCVLGVSLANVVAQQPGNIAMAYKKDVCLELAGGNTTNGHKVQIWNCNGYDQQQWMIDGEKIRYGSDTSKCIDANGMMDKQHLRIWDCEDVAQQSWVYDRDTAHLTLSYSLEESDGTMCMGIDGGSNDGNRARAMKCTTIWSEMWTLPTTPTPSPKPSPPVPPTPTPPGSAPLMVAANTDFCVGAKGGSSDNGTPLQLWKCSGSQAQQWLFKDGAMMTALDKNQCVDAGPDMPKAFGVMLWACNGYPQQQWGFDSEGMQTIYLSESQSNSDVGASLCIDIPGADLRLGNKLWTWSCTGGDGQAFVQSTKGAELEVL